MTCLRSCRLPPTPPLPGEPGTVGADSHLLGRDQRNRTQFPHQSCLPKPVSLDARHVMFLTSFPAQPAFSRTYAIATMLAVVRHFFPLSWLNARSGRGTAQTFQGTDSVTKSLRAALFIFSSRVAQPLLHGGWRAHTSGQAMDSQGKMIMGIHPGPGDAIRTQVPEVMLFNMWS